MPMWPSIVLTSAAKYLCLWFEIIMAGLWFCSGSELSKASLKTPYRDAVSSKVSVTAIVFPLRPLIDPAIQWTPFGNAITLPRFCCLYRAMEVTGRCLNSVIERMFCCFGKIEL